jgi:hypothetical protein
MVTELATTVTVAFTVTRRKGEWVCALCRPAGLQVIH